MLQLAKSPGRSRQKLNLPKSDRRYKFDLWIVVGENRKWCHANETKVPFIKTAARRAARIPTLIEAQTLFCSLKFGRIGDGSVASEQDTGA